MTIEGVASDRASDNQVARLLYELQRRFLVWVTYSLYTNFKNTFDLKCQTQATRLLLHDSTIASHFENAPARPCPKSVTSTLCFALALVHCVSD
jgi:hypothetical protein